MKNQNWKELDTLKVLSVDDHEINCEFIQAALNPLLAALEVARNGHQAIRMCLKHRFDLVLMDLHMPDMDGISTWEHIVHRLEPDDLPYVIALTAENRPEERERLRNAGFHGYLYKPVSIELLTQTMLRVVNGHSGFSHLDDADESRNRLLDDKRALAANGKSERVMQMRTALAEDLVERLPMLDQHMAEGQYKHAAELLHQWAGGAGYAGASRLQNACLAMETSLRNELDSSPGTLYMEVVRRLECTVQSIHLNRPVQA